jgi:ADP-dependent NAD(P)H-hydrate dehydratase / NAD(P)H-hydrate epimerase
MIPVLTAAEMREADRRAIEERGVPGLVLMENAGAAVAAALRERYPAARRVAVVCGKGNNGGDGFVAARHLLDLAPGVYLLARRQDVKGDAAAHLEKLQAEGGVVQEAPDEAAWEAVSAQALDCDVMVDAILGTGLREAPTGLPRRVINDAAQAAANGLPVVAVDVPSGLSSDTGDVRWDHVRAALTVTFAAPKYCHVLPRACDRVGELTIADIGIPAAVLGGRHALWLLEPRDAAAAWPPRDPDANKGTYGRILVVAGSVGKTGAAVLAGLGALRAGAGLVTVATPASALPLVAVARPELMTEPLAEAPDGGLHAGALERALEMAHARDAVVIGPGLGQAPGTRAFVQAFVGRCQVPVVVDADALNAFGASESAPPALELLRRSRSTVLTPHPGEMARLLGGSARHIQERRLAAAQELAAATNAVVVLKGRRTIVADGEKAAVNPTGNPGMATGGTGDVLSGIVGALLARGGDAWTAATAAVYAHGLAGDLAAERLGQESMLAGDLADALSGALRSLEVGHR